MLLNDATRVILLCSASVLGACTYNTYPPGSTLYNSQNPTHYVTMSNDYAQPQPNLQQPPAATVNAANNEDVLVVPPIASTAPKVVSEEPKPAAVPEPVEGPPSARLSGTRVAGSAAITAETDGVAVEDGLLVTLGEIGEIVIELAPFGI